MGGGSSSVVGCWSPNPFIESWSLSLKVSSCLMARSPTLELELFADGGFFSPASSITTDRAEGSRRSLRKLGTRAAVRARRSGPSGDPTCTTMSRSCLVARAPADAACSSSWPAAAYLTLCLAQTYRTSLLPTWRTGCGRVCAHVWRRGSSCSPFWARASRSFCATPNARILCSTKRGTR